MNALRNQFLFLSLVGLCVWLCVEGKAEAKMKRFAILIGNNDPGGRAEKLSYAEQDAQKMQMLLTQVAGFRAADITTLLGQKASQVMKAFQAAKGKIVRWKRSHPNGQVMLFVYYSGHIRKERLYLGSSTLSFRALSRSFREAGASLRLGIFDACESGGLTQIRGLRRRRKGFKVPSLQVASATRGEVILTATGARENAHEDPDLRGGIFTHYLATGLRGAADRNKDGFVTLEEAYDYVYIRALQRTMLSAHGPQRARFLKKLSGRGSLVLATLSKHSSLVLPAPLSGQFFIWNEAQDSLLAELKKKKGHQIAIALSPGAFSVRWRRGKQLFAARIRLQGGQTIIIPSSRTRSFPWRLLPTKGNQFLSSAGYIERYLLRLTPKPGFGGGFELQQGDKVYSSSDLLFKSDLLLAEVPEALQIAKGLGSLTTAGIALMVVSLVTLPLGSGVMLFDLFSGLFGTATQGLGIWFALGIGLMGVSLVCIVIYSILFAEVSRRATLAYKTYNREILRRARARRVSSSALPSHKPATSLPPVSKATPLTLIRF